MVKWPGRIAAFCLIAASAPACFAALAPGVAGAPPVCDGASHPLTARYPGASLAQVRRVFPAARALTDETDLAAINSALLNGGDLMLPATAGSAACVVNGPVLLTSNGALAGRGIGASVIRAVPAPGKRVVDFPVVALGMFFPRAPLSGMTVSGLTADGGAPPDGADVWDRPAIGNAAGIYVGPLSRNFRIERVEARCSFGNGITISGQDGELSDSYAHDNWSNGIYVMGVYNNGQPIYTERVRVLRNRVSHNSLYNYPSGARLDGGGAVWTPQPAAFDGGHPYSFDGIDVDGLFRDINVDNNRVSGNDIIVLERGNYRGGSFGSASASVVGNFVSGSFENGFNVTGRITGVQILRNTVVGLAEANSAPHGNGPHGCLTLVGPVSRLEFSGNRCEGAASYGVLAYGRQGAPSGITISDNVFQMAPDIRFGRFSVVTFRQGSDVKVLDNRIVESAGAGLAAGAVDVRQAGGAEVLGNTVAAAPP